MLAYHFQASPRLSWETDIFLPCDDPLWEASDATSWHDAPGWSLGEFNTAFCTTYHLTSLRESFTTQSFADPLHGKEIASAYRRVRENLPDSWSVP